MQQGIIKTMVIDPKKGVYFDDNEHVEVMPMICRNDNKEYAVMINQDDDLKALELPDGCKYYDPGEYGNVLTMPAHKKLFTRRLGLFSQLAPWVLAVIIGIVGTVIVIVGNPAS